MLVAAGEVRKARLGGQDAVPADRRGRDENATAAATAQRCIAVPTKIGTPTPGQNRPGRVRRNDSRLSDV